MLRSLLLFIPLVSIACAQSKTASPVTRPTSELTITTANIRYSAANDGINAWPARKEALIARLRATDSDVIGVQEALADQQDALVAAFADYQSVGVGREDGDRKGEFASLFIRKARFDVLESGTFWLSPTPEKIGSVGWDAALTRICTWARVRDKAANRELLLANTHFDHKGVLAREESAKLIASRLPTLFPGRPMILTGDFNSDDTSTAYRAILASGLVDAYRVVHPTVEPNEASFHAFKGTTAGRRIDYIFTSPEMRAFSATIDRKPIGDGKYVSDHYFVTATLGWK